MSNKKIAIAISYINLLVGMVVNIYITPLLIAALGDVDYSLYKVMHSLAGPLTMFHLGVSTVVTRSVVKNKEGNIREKQNTMALALLASGVMSLLVMIAGAVLYMAIPAMYGQTYSVVSIRQGQKMFVMFIAASVLHMLTDAFSGCVVGHERYVVSSAIPLAKNLGKCILLIGLAKTGMGVLFVVGVDLFLAAVTFLFTMVYAVFGLHEIPKLYYVDKTQLTEIVTFGLAILLQAFVNQVNNNMDTMILGAFIAEKAVITMYSSALAVYAIYNSLVSVITHYFLPQATELTVNHASGKEMTDFIVKPGRFQAVVALACIFGFALFGRNFIRIWIGERYLDAYGVILTLMIPVTIPLVENAVISILDATMKRMYRSVVLVVMAVLNLAISVTLVQNVGFWGAAIGTAASLLIGHGVLMNLYYAKEFNIEVFRMFKEIFKGILPAGLVAAVVCLPIAILLPDTLLWFVLKCSSFVLAYAVFLLAFGFNQGEKVMLRTLVRKARHK